MLERKLNCISNTLYLVCLKEFDKRPIKQMVDIHFNECLNFYPKGKPLHQVICAHGELFVTIR